MIHTNKTVRLKYLADVIAGQSPNGDDVSDVGSLPFIQGCAEFGALHPNPVKYCDVSPKTAQSGDVLISVRAPVGEINVANGAIGIGRGVAAIRSQDDIDSRFLMWFLESSRKNLRLQSTGSTFESVSAGDISNLAIPLHKREIQIAIAAYLDAETKRIDGLIEGKVELQLLLQELKRNTLTKSLHEGLDPDSDMNESGTSWFSELPVRWRPMRLKRVIDGIENGWSPQCEGEPAEAGHWGVLKAGACNGGVFKVNENKALPANETPRPELEIKRGNVLMSRASGSLDLVGSVAYVEEVQPGLMLSDKIFRLNINEELVCGEWLALALNSTPMRRQIASFVGGAEGLARNIASSAIRELVLPVPPREEQVEIVQSVKRDMERIEELVVHVDEEIAVLKELRSATITDAVLGRIDVRKSQTH